MLWQLLRRFKTSGSLRCLGPIDVSSMLEKLLKECADKAAAIIVKDAALQENLKTDNYLVTDWMSDPKVCAAARLLQDQAVIAYPTESVWGLGCDPGSFDAVEKLLQLKGRSVSKGLILIAASAEQFAPLLRGLEPSALKRFQMPQQKPTTWLVPNNGVTPEWIGGGHDTLALRITNHPLAAALCRLFGGPLVSTSANPQGLPAAINADQARGYFGQAVDCYTPGSVGGAAKPSEIRHLMTGDIVREG